MRMSLAPGPPLSTARTAFAPNLHKPSTAACTPPTHRSHRPIPGGIDDRRRGATAGSQSTDRSPDGNSPAFLASDNLLARAIGARPSDPAPAHPAQHDRQRHRRPAHLRGRGNEERQRGLGRPADLRRPDDRPALSPRATAQAIASLTLLPEKLTIDGRIEPEQRRRGLFTVNVYTATLDVVAEFQTSRLRAMAADGRHRRLVGRSPGGRPQRHARSIEGDDGRRRRPEGRLDAWLGQHAVLAQGAPRHAGAGRPGDSLGALQPCPGRQRQARSGAARPAHRGDAVAPWPAPSFTRPLARSAQTVDKDGFRARWSASHLGRPYGQLWDSASLQKPGA